jgi:hypothetical protein
MENIIIILLIAVIIYFIYMNSKKNEVESFYDPNCAAWAKGKECIKNPLWMLPNCPNECNREVKIKEMINYLNNVLSEENNLIIERNQLLKLFDDAVGIKLLYKIDNNTDELIRLYEEFNSMGRMYEPYTRKSFNIGLEKKSRGELKPFIPQILADYNNSGFNWFSEGFSTFATRENNLIQERNNLLKGLNAEARNILSIIDNNIDTLIRFYEKFNYMGKMYQQYTGMSYNIGLEKWSTGELKPFVPQILNDLISQNDWLNIK